MSNGLSRFNYYLDNIEVQLQQAARERNPGLWLYSNDLRTPMFMLQALCRLYGSMHNQKKFDKLKDDFKLLEDGMGAIDYYENYAKVFLTNPNVPAPTRDYMQAQAREKIQHVNDILQNRNWLGKDDNRLQKIRKQLKALDWMKAKDEVKAIQSFYKEEIKEIKNFWNSSGAKFTEMEDHLHEFRRDLRWLSIYPQALQGMIQLVDTRPTKEAITKYLVDDIVHSKYNVMPARGTNKWLLLLEKNYFYALSWMIAETGKFKDEGLQFFAVAEAVQQTEGLKHDEAMQRAFNMLSAGNNPIPSILERSSALTATFIAERNLEELISGVEEISSGKTRNEATE